MRIEDDAHRVGPRACAHRQLGVVGDGGAGSDDHGVGEGAEVVQMSAVFLAGDIVGVAGAGGDETVQALAELREGQARAGQAQRQIAIGEDARPGRDLLPPPQAAVGAADQPGGLGVRLGPDGAQPFPGRPLVERGHRGSFRVSREKYSAKESTSAVRISFPFSAVAREGRPMTPDSV